MSFTFNDEHAFIVVTILENNIININGNIYNPSKYKLMELIAPNPIDRGMSYQGSGLPFANPEIAFSGSINNFQIPENGTISNVLFKYPNSYYAVGAYEKIKPSIFLILYSMTEEEPIHIRLELTDPLPLHTLKYRPNHVKGPLYYSVKEVLVTMEGAEATARAYGNAKIEYDIA
jgi:hypothetical protein